MTLIHLILRKPKISTGSNGPLGSEKDLALAWDNSLANLETKLEVLQLG